MPSCQPISRRSAAVLLAALACASLAVGCGGAGSGPTVARVGGAAIDRDSVEHWTSVLERGGTPSVLGGEAPGTPTQKALAFLVSAAWLQGEARREGLDISDRAVERSLAQRREVSGNAEFEQGLEASGQTTADTELEARAELAAAAIREALARRAAAVSEATVVGYYRRNAAQFHHHEARDIEIVRGLPSAAAASALVERVGTGAGFTRIATPEGLAQNTVAPTGPPTKDPLLRAIFAARAGVVSAPVRSNGKWAVFIVRKIEPPTLKPLSEVRPEILERLVAQRRAAMTTRFDREYVQRWSARTECTQGYVIPGCAHYAGGAETAADPFSEG
jgi:hypothetical protein